ncbi:MAG: helix-turn-helix domain-containing protein [Gammaproteobacteria bacterium]
MKSSRADGLGHWPEGKRRREAPLPAELRRRILAARKAGEMSLRSLARQAGISDRALRRWLAGEDWPAREKVAALRTVVGV